MSNSIECHFCREQKAKMSVECFVAKCCIKRCNTYYCINCIRQNFNPLFQPVHYRKDTWICYACQKSCTCQYCKMQEVQQLERKASRKKSTKGQPWSKLNEESVEVQSVSNISLNTSKPQQHGLAISLGSNQQQQADPQSDIVSDYRVHEAMLIPNDSIIMMPLFMQKLARRKNMYFEFMKNYKPQAKVEKKQSMKNTKIKQLITRAINDRKGDYQENDIEPVEL